MNSILNLPLPDRCETISRLVYECTNKELENFFPLLIDDLFGITNQVGWKLRQIKFNTNATEYEVLCKFLHPNGPVFKLCYKLLSDCHLKYDFPLAYLPMKVQKTISDGIVQSFYADKLQIDPKSRTPFALALNPFELYMFHFVYHLVNPNIQVPSDLNQWMHWDFLYIRLVEEYFNVFLPCVESSAFMPPYVYAPQSPTRSHSVNSNISKSVRSPTLLKESVIMNMTSSVQHNSLHSSVQSTHQVLELWRSELVAQLCIDFWLSTSNYDPHFYNNDFQSNRLPIWTQCQSDFMNYNKKFAGPVWSQQFLPTGEHLRVVRFMVKHLHYFSNSSVEDSSAMDELKRVILPSCQNKIYRFLRYTMQDWPLDTSFRLVLETWLSYIQPWRYQDITRRSRDMDDSCRTPFVEPHWIQFIAENLLVYTLIFQQLLARFSRVDLATPKNAIMLYRVAKVFSLGNLIDYLKSVEGALEEGKLGSSKWSGIVRQHIVDLEGLGFQYRTLFGAETKAEVMKFQGYIHQSLITAQSRLESEVVNQKTGFLCWLTMQSFCSEFTIDERKKVITNLSLSRDALKNIFQLEDVQNVAPNNLILDTTISSNSSPAQQNFICTRFDSIRHIRDIKYEGDPDLVPIRSFENAFLVRTLYQASLWINSNYYNKIQELYRRDDWVGGITRQTLSGPQLIHTYTRSGPGGYSPRVSSMLPPRISLRVWAHHRTIVLLLISYLFFYFINCPIIIGVILLILTWFLLLLFKYSIGFAPKPPISSSFNSSF